MEFLLALAIIAVVGWFVTAPLRGGGEGATTEDPRIADLEARKEAKYREIRDAELDREQGKLSKADWARVDAELRREAIAILKELDAARGKGEEPRERSAQG